MAQSDKKRLAVLRDQLLSAQAQLVRERSFALAVVVTGMPTAGRSETVNQFLEWLDPKHIAVHALDKLRVRAQLRPPMWRYWLTLPARGEIAFYFTGWYEDVLVPALHTPKKAKRHEARMFARIKQFEAMLTNEQVCIVKFDMRIDKRTQKERLAALRANKLTRWRVTREDRWFAKHYTRLSKAMDRIVKATSTPAATWHPVDGADPQQRSLKVGALMLKELTSGAKTRAAASASLTARSAAKRRQPLPSEPPLEVTDEAYEQELELLQGRLALLTRKRSFLERGLVLAFEGMDAAGKGGAIRHVTAALDARQYAVVPVSAPNEQELAYPYLWRFWRRLPERGEITIFDRSWYGRVLVERAREFTPESTWRRAYDEINEFELQLTEANFIVQKLWLSVGKDAQLQRFKAREADPLKRYKVDEEDWENRRCYDAYQAAAAEMIERTSTEEAPWAVVEADDKKYARLKVLRAVRERIELAIKS